MTKIYHSFAPASVPVSTVPDVKVCMQVDLQKADRRQQYLLTQCDSASYTLLGICICETEQCVIK